MYVYGNVNNNMNNFTKHFGFSYIKTSQGLQIDLYFYTWHWVKTFKI